MYKDYQTVAKKSTNQIDSMVCRSKGILPMSVGKKLANGMAGGNFGFLYLHFKSLTSSCGKIDQYSPKQSFRR